MRVWRLTRKVHAALDGEGARSYGGRWNSPGQPVIYTANSAALAVLEVLVHLDLPLDMLPSDFHLMSIDLGELEIEELPAYGTGDPLPFGDLWIAERRSPALRVPSVIVPEEWNLLVNPLHPAAGKIKVASMRPFRFDPRLF